MNIETKLEIIHTSWDLDSIIKDQFLLSVNLNKATEKLYKNIN